MIKKGFHYLRFLNAFINWRFIKRLDLIFFSDLVYGKGIFFSKKNVFSIGRGCFIGYGCHFGSDVKIGDSVMFAPRVALVGGDHDISDKRVIIKDSGRANCKLINIEANVWVGYGSIIMHGVTIGEGAVIAAGSVVTKDVEKFTIVAGVPAKKLRDR